MTIRYQQPGSKMDWVNGTGGDVAVNTVVVVGSRIGVTLDAIADGATGSVALEGVFSGVAKTTGTAWGQGDAVYWDVSTSRFAKSGTPASGDITGAVIAFEPALSAAATGTIKLCNSGTVTA